MDQLRSLLGLVAALAIAWLIGGAKRSVSWRLIIGGVALQFAIAAILINPVARGPFEAVSNAFASTVDGAAAVGADFVFGIRPDTEETAAGVKRSLLIRSFAFGVLPTVIFFSAVMSVLYYLRLMQPVVGVTSLVMRKTLGTTGPETLAASANIFVGHTEAPLVIKPYLSTMTRSELNALMTGGFASVTGALLFAYASFGAPIDHLLIACFISAPASLVIAKLIVPADPSGQALAAGSAISGQELAVGSGTHGTNGTSVTTDTPVGPTNLIDAVVSGASDGLKMALNIAAMLIAFLALIALVNALLAYACHGLGWVQADGTAAVTLERIAGWVFAPLAYLLGIAPQDTLLGGELLGLKVIANEFVAYERLGELRESMQDRTRILMTYALCGFSNLGAIGIQVGGISALVPHRRSEIASLGLKAMIGGFLACNMTACVIGVMI